MSRADGIAGIGVRVFQEPDGVPPDIWGTFMTVSS